MRINVQWTSEITPKGGTFALILLKYNIENVEVESCWQDLQTCPQTWDVAADDADVAI